MSLIGIDKTQGKFRIQTEQKGVLIVVVRVTYVPKDITGTLTCSPNDDAVNRAISRLKASITHTKDPLRAGNKDKDLRVANYGKAKRGKK